MSENHTPANNIDIFELIVAILLGMSALGSAWAGFQSSLWGGNMSTSYAKANTIAIEGATAKTDAMIQIAQDFQIDIMGKKLLREAKSAKSPVVREEKLEMARYLYSWQLSNDAYQSLDLPYEKHASSHGYEDADELSEEELLEFALVNDLDDDGNTYEEDQVKAANALFKKAHATFEEGRAYNTRGDRFTLDGVIYTIALFFAGVSLVFKTRIKWFFMGAGWIVFGFASYLLFTMEWVASWV